MEIKKLQIQIYQVVLSIISVYSVQSMLKIQNNELNVISNSVFGFILFVLCLLFYKHLFNTKVNKQTFVYSIVVALIFSFCMVVGPQIMIHDDGGVLRKLIWFKVLSGIPLWLSIILSVYRYVPKIIDSENNVRLNKKSYLAIWLLIFIAWIPVLLASFPGIYSYDAPYQLLWYRLGVLYLQHPIIHTYLLGFCVEYLGGVFGSAEVGLLIYSLLQMLILSSALAIIVFYMTQKRVNSKIVLLTLFCFMFLPTNPIMAISATKDIIYASTLVWVIYVNTRMLVDNKANDMKYIIAFIISNFVNIIFRSQGIYVFILTSLVGLFVFRKNIFKYGLMVLSVLCIFAIYNGPLTDAIGGVKNVDLRYREMMSVPVMQLSRVATYEKLSPKEVEQISQYVPNYGAYRQNQLAISDVMKANFNTVLFRKKPTKFLKTYLYFAKKYPNDYLNAFLRLTIGLWYPDMNYDDNQAYHPLWYFNSYTRKDLNDSSLEVVSVKPLYGFKWLNKLLAKSSGGFGKLPIVSIFFSTGILLWGLLLYTGWIFSTKKYVCLYIVMPLLGLFATLLLGPVVLYRYVYPIAISLPLLLTTLTSDRIVMQKGANSMK